MHLSTRHIALAAVSAAVTAAACSRDDEAAMRARLSPWFGLGETLAFAARSDCAAAAFRLVHGGIGASMAVEASVPEMLRALPGRGAAAVDDPQLAPDTVMVEAANAERAIGMAMRRAFFVLATRLALAFALVPPAARGQEFVHLAGPVPDDVFYRVVACAAPPGGACAKPMIRWPEDRRMRLRVGIAAVSMIFPDYKFDLIDRALDDAIAEINASGAALFLTRVYEGALDVPIFLVDTPQGGQIAGTSLPELDGAEMAIARVALRSRGPYIVGSAIAISQDVGRREIASVVLEELVQAMGLPTDVAGPDYDRSVFSETHNSTVWLRGQDAAALRYHYPRR